jgi:NADH dehydrogenase
MNSKQKICIIGGGFGGVQTALDLAQNHGSNVEITLVSDRPNFEYYPALHSFLSVAGPINYYHVPLSDIFENRQVNLVIEKVISCDLATKTITLESGKALVSDYVVLALGSQSTFFGIEGIPAMAFPFQNATDAQNLRTHVETLFKKHCSVEKVTPECVVGLHFVVVGAGPNGVDLAGELASFTKYLCKANSIPESAVTIDIIEGASGVLPMMPKEVQDIATKRLRNLGVNVLCNRQLMKQGSWTVVLSDMTLGAKTVIWTAGTTGNELVTKIPNLVLQKKNRITVNDHLEINEYPNCFVVGDIADTQYSGLAQTAIHDGSYVADVIIGKLEGGTIPAYIPKPVAYNIGVGHGWSITKIGNVVISGRMSSWLRKIIDLKYFLSILPVHKVLALNPFKHKNQ